MYKGQTGISHVGSNRYVRTKYVQVNFLYVELLQNRVFVFSGGGGGGGRNCLKYTWMDIKCSPG